MLLTSWAMKTSSALSEECASGHGGIAAIADHEPLAIEKTIRARHDGGPSATRVQSFRRLISVLNTARVPDVSR
jgi:hypothetical protein